jgi:hypothetical protein
MSDTVLLVLALSAALTAVVWFLRDRRFRFTATLFRILKVDVHGQDAPVPPPSQLRRSVRSNRKKKAPAITDGNQSA